MLRFLDAGESHGIGIVTIVEGMPYGVPVGASDIGGELARRRLGYGRGERMRLESDKAEILSGIRNGMTLGSPVAIRVMNAEYAKWKQTMSREKIPDVDALTMLRPGHADMAGALKYGTRDVRDILERASARETVGRVCAGSLAKRILTELEIAIGSHVVAIGGVGGSGHMPIPERKRIMAVDADPMRCLDEDVSRRMREEVDRTREEGDSLGGVFEVLAYGLPAGLGSHVHWDRRLDGRLAAAVMSIQAVKGVEIGGGFKLSSVRGSDAADIISHGEDEGFYHLSNRAGGIEGGITNGEVLVLRAAMKPIPTLAHPLDSIDLVSKERVKAAVERSDVCAVPAAAVIAESMVAFVLADALLEKTGGDNMEEVRSRFAAIIKEQMRF
ncbi:MAG: chorismate synthase [Actinobacteria bacterium]|nr:chorismate synthase [Actinomycetota bacterium]